MEDCLERSTIRRIFRQPVLLFFPMMFFNYLDRIINFIGFAGLRMNQDLGFSPATFAARQAGIAGLVADGSCGTAPRSLPPDFRCFRAGPG